MYKHQPIEPKPETLRVVFQSTVTLWECQKSDYGTPVKEIEIKNPDVVTYHTYGKGITAYYVEWFDESVRPLKKYNIQFDTLQIKSIEFVNSTYSIYEQH